MRECDTLSDLLWADAKANPNDYVEHPNGGGLIHKTAQVHPDAKIEKGAIVGAGCIIHPHVWLDKEVAVGKNVALMPESFFHGGRSEIWDESIFGANSQ